MAITDEEKKQLKKEILDEIRASSQSVADLKEATSLVGVDSLPALQNTEVVRVPLSLLSGGCNGIAVADKVTALDVLPAWLAKGQTVFMRHGVGFIPIGSVIFRDGRGNTAAHVKVVRHNSASDEYSVAPGGLLKTAMAEFDLPSSFGAFAFFYQNPLKYEFLIGAEWITADGVSNKIPMGATRVRVSVHKEGGTPIKRLTFAVSVDAFPQWKIPKGTPVLLRLKGLHGFDLSEWEKISIWNGHIKQKGSDTSYNVFGRKLAASTDITRYPFLRHYHFSAIDSSLNLENLTKPVLRKNERLCLLVRRRAMSRSSYGDKTFIRYALDRSGLAKICAMIGSYPKGVKTSMKYLCSKQGDSRVIQFIDFAIGVERGNRKVRPVVRGPFLFYRLTKKGGLYSIDLK